MADSEWVLLAYRLPREPSGPRVTVWRKLRRLGAVQLVDGLVALPANPETVEAFGWLADEVVEAGGEAWTWQAAGSKAQDRALRQRLKTAVVEEYAALAAEAKTARADRRTVQRLRRTLRAIERRDYSAPRERDEARARGPAVGRVFGHHGGGAVKWATRPGCHVDRAACAWLLRRFVDPEAAFVFIEDTDDVPADATPFDMRGVELSHHNGDCSFETILRHFQLDDPVLWDVAQVVHEADLADDRYDEPTAPGLDVICRGLTLVADDDRVLEVTAVLFDGLYEYRRQLLRGDRPG